MESITKLACALLLLVLGLKGGASTSNECENFPALYNFGDSNSDTGATSAAVGLVPPPNGETFFGSPSGRLSDGRLIIDFIAERLKFPYLSAYLDSVGANFSHGANFAVAGSGIQPGGYNPWHLGLQVSQFIQFKNRIKALHDKVSDKKTNQSFNGLLPEPEDFSKALYTIDIGQNDLSYGIRFTDTQKVYASLPDILDKFSESVQRLHKEGARFFWIHNTGPFGCLPYVLYDKRNSTNLDRNGCLQTENEVAQEFNKQLKEKVSKLREQLSNATFTYVDIYSVKYSLIDNARREGFIEPLTLCCGGFHVNHIICGKPVTVNGTVYGTSCDNPSQHISWDGVHYTEAANSRVTIQILNGSFSDPPVSIEKACLHGGDVSS